MVLPTGQYRRETLLQPGTEPGHVDVGDCRGKVDAGTPAGKRRHRRQPRHMLAIPLRGGAGNAATVFVRIAAHAPGDDKAGGQPFHVPFERRRQRLVKIVDIEHRRSFRRRIGAEICQMAVAAGLGAQRGGRHAGEVRRHDRSPTAQEGKRVGFHPRVANRKKLRKAALALLDQDFDRIAPVVRRLPRALGAARNLTAPAGSGRAPFGERRGFNGTVTVLRGCIHGLHRYCHKLCLALTIPLFPALRSAAMDGAWLVHAANVYPRGYVPRRRRRCAPCVAG